MIKIATWNVNSVKSRITHLLDYLHSSEAPDILALQELKCETDNFPYLELETTGYNVAVHGQKTYNGVAILSKFPIDEYHTTLHFDDIDQSQARFMEAVISVKNQTIRLINVYVPNGHSPDSDKFSYKKIFYDCLTEHVKQALSHQEKFIVLGDFNVAPEPNDVYDPKQLEGTICFHPHERAKLRSLMNLGLTDAYRAFNPDEIQYSWWDYRAGGWQHNKGLRIDHLLMSPEAADACTGAGVDSDLRALDKPSDHAPVWCYLKF